MLKYIILTIKNSSWLTENYLENGGGLVAKSWPTLAAPRAVAPLSVGFPKQEYWSGLPFPSPGDLPDLEIEPRFPSL